MAKAIEQYLFVSKQIQNMEDVKTLRRTKIMIKNQLIVNMTSRNFDIIGIPDNEQCIQMTLENKDPNLKDEYLLTHMYFTYLHTDKKNTFLDYIRSNLKQRNVTKITLRKLKLNEQFHDISKFNDLFETMKEYIRITNLLNNNTYLKDLQKNRKESKEIILNYLVSNKCVSYEHDKNYIILHRKHDNKYKMTLEGISTCYEVYCNSKANETKDFGSFVTSYFKRMNSDTSGSGEVVYSFKILEHS